MISSTQLALLESGLKRYLDADPDSRTRLAPLKGRSIRIDSWLINDLSVFLSFGDEGITLTSDLDGSPDATIKGGPASFLRSAANPADRTVFSDGSLVVEGDATLVQSFAEVFRLYEMDWQQKVSPVIGDALTWRLETTLEHIIQWRNNALQKFKMDTGDYLREEKRIVAPAESISGFSDAVDDLVSDVARLEQRLRRLEQSQ